MPVNGALLVGWLAAVVGATDAGAAELGDGLAAPLQAAKTIATVPITARGDHLVVRDMHSSSNGSLDRDLVACESPLGASVPRAIGPRAAGRGCREA